MQFDITDRSLGHQGELRAQWAEQEMPVLRGIRDRFAATQPLKEVKIAACLHVTSETANLALTLKAGGANLVLCASNPLSTQDDIAAYLVDQGIPVFARNGEDAETYYAHINAAADTAPQVTIDDGADLVAVLHSDKQHLLEHAIGGMEETTTGVIRLKALHAEGKLAYPIVAVNDSMTKHMFDNRYGTGQSTLDGIIRATNMLITGKTVVVIGYGWCGRGFADRARGLGAHTVVCEVDPVRALEAVMDGHRVMSVNEAAPQGDIFLTVTGGLHAIDAQHFDAMKDGAVVANSGHFNVEVNIDALEEMSESKRRIRPFVEEYVIEDGRRVYLLAEGRLVNLAAAEGHPPSVMDMSFANQALAAEHIVNNHQSMEPGVYTLPEEIDKDIAALKLRSMGMAFDELTPAQFKYLNSWESGT